MELWLPWLACPEHIKALQKALLDEEGVEVSKDFMIDLDRYGWWG